MIPCSKLTDRWGRKRCFIAGLVLYGIGALLSAAAPGLGVLILGNSVLEGVGTALLIPPVYILATLHFADLTSRARAFGVISGLGGIGAAAGPLIGGLITTASAGGPRSSSRPLVVAAIVLLSRRIVDPLPAGPDAPVRRHRRDPVGRRDVLRGVRHPPGRQRPRAHGGVPRRPAPPSWPGSSSTSAARERAGQGAAAVHRAVQEPHVEPRAGHAEHPVAAAHGDVVRRSPSSSRPCAATTPSRRASSSPRRRSASWSPRSRRSGSRSGARSGR